MLITVEKYYERNHRNADFIVADLIPEDGLLLSAIGARICYSNNHPVDLLENDTRIFDNESRFNFLARLARAKHYSVFAHSPVFADIHYADIQAILQLYKAWFFPGEPFCLNGRHLVEAHQGIKGEWLNVKSTIKMLIYDYEGAQYWEDYYPDTRPSKCLICLYIDKKPWQWFSIIIHGFSVIMTHQLVRHTWLNFSQRSHRYTEVDGYVIPKSLFLSDIKIGDARIPANLFLEEQYQNAEYAYGILLENGIPKEDARFVTPSGRKTTIMASGPRFVWEDFVNKRAHSKAQLEIREIANAIKQLLWASL